jgi:hypothetical protein
MYLRFRRTSPGGQPPAKFHDPPALQAKPRLFFWLSRFNDLRSDDPNHQST